MPMELASGMRKSTDSEKLSITRFSPTKFSFIEDVFMARINSNYDKLAAGYLFPEIARRTNAFLEANSGTQVLRLGIGDTTEPIVPPCWTVFTRELKTLVMSRHTPVMVHPRACFPPCVRASADLYAERGMKLDPSEFFVSDGAKSTLLIFRVFFPRTV